MRVAIIGAGSSGLTCIKSCNDDGLEPVCFEEEDTIGGLWYFTEEERHSSVYGSTVINTSKEMMCFSDFPIPKEFPPYMHHRKIMEYFHLYAKEFDLYKFIRFRTKVVEIRKTPDFDETGKWEILFRELDGADSKEVKVEIYDAVMLCVGHHSEPSWPSPSFPGQDRFEGLKMHSHSYKDFKPFEKKKVLIVGIGNSGGDIAVELSRHTQQVYLSTRRGAWILSRLGRGGKPADQEALTRFTAMLPLKLTGSLFLKLINQRFDHDHFALRPQHSVFGQHPMVNDDLPHRIITGTIIVKPNVSHFTKTGVVFDDGTQVNDLDVVIFCTGYKIGYKCVDQAVLPVSDNKVELYKYVFPPNLSKPTLAVLGCIQPFGAIFPLAELQARWATQVFRGKKFLPPKDVMMDSIQKKREEMAQRFYASKRHTIQVDYVPYADELATEVGCKPDLWRLLLRDPALALKCFFGPCTPAQFRLMGPGAWEGAKKAIEDAPGNVIYATKTRSLPKEEEAEKNTSVFNMGILVLFVVLAVCIRILF
ncbi:PREDICTED: dimethylaniline monooxygenase [N-oxide-forming] 5-like [Acropora digitifera]|uniref:dimethylaniline monooxygenase [N-oxide-forming] 5-like n=1 Tax=Acropora digitifera TaxID=70779 RepID=UPI00077AE4A0|nr:PREDICTED: dimethylaniline monooxygenase [N-oxide-forming] 5-like [Acropora digitifera]